MAINGSDKSFAFMEFPLSMSRQDAFPLDKSSVFYSMSEAETYAQTSPLAYVGQHISVVEGGTSTAYQIKNETATWSPWVPPLFLLPLMKRSVKCSMRCLAPKPKRQIFFE